MTPGRWQFCKTVVECGKKYRGLFCWSEIQHEWQALSVVRITVLLFGSFYCKKTATRNDVVRWKRERVKRRKGEKQKLFVNIRRHCVCGEDRQRSHRQLLITACFLQILKYYKIPFSLFFYFVILFIGCHVNVIGAPCPSDVPLLLSIRPRDLFPTKVYFFIF